MTDQTEKAARLLHASLTKRGISQSWKTCQNRMQYREAARELLQAIGGGPVTDFQHTAEEAAGLGLYEEATARALVEISDYLSVIAANVDHYVEWATTEAEDE